MTNFCPNIYHRNLHNLNKILCATHFLICIPCRTNLLPYQMYLLCVIKKHQDCTIIHDRDIVFKHRVSLRRTFLVDKVFHDTKTQTFPRRSSLSVCVYVMSILSLVSHGSNCQKMVRTKYFVAEMTFFDTADLFLTCFYPP